MIANEVAEQLKDSKVFSQVEAVAPGFLNLKLSDDFLCGYLKEMEAGEKFGMEMPAEEKDHHRGLRRTECGETPACGASAFCRHRGKR